MSIKQRLMDIGVSVVVISIGGCLGEEPDDTLPVLGPIDLASVAVGAFHACGLDPQGRGYCWGANGLGQLGVGDQDDHFQPISIAQGEIRFTTIFGGGAHTCATVVGTNNVMCWGANSEGQLGTGQQLAGTIEPQPSVVVQDASFTAVGGDAGDQHTCTINRDREAFCWGSANKGQLGSGLTGDGEFRGAPQAVLGGHLFEEITTGSEHSCARTVAGDAYCWGDNSEGQLGTGDNTGSAEPVAVQGGHLYFVIDAGRNHTCGVTVDSDAYCWGSNDAGQLGIGSFSPQTEPTLVSGGLQWADISAGGSHTCAVTLSSSEVYCWGLNNAGQLGDGSLIDRDVPTAVVTNETFVTVETGLGQFDTANCALSVTDLVYCWGFGASGQVGDGSGDTKRTPTLVRRQPAP